MKKYMRLENPLVCNQDGFHVMNGHEAINLTTEVNAICKTDFKNDINDQCPKRPARPAPTPCCSNKIGMQISGKKINF